MRLVLCCRAVERDVRQVTCALLPAHLLDRSTASSCGRPVRSTAPPRIVAFIARSLSSRSTRQARCRCSPCSCCESNCARSRVFLDVVVCITIYSVVPLMLACRQCHNWLCDLHYYQQTAHVFSGSSFSAQVPGHWISSMHLNYVKRMPKQHEK